MNNNTESRTIIAIVLCVVFYLGYTEYLKRKYPDFNNPDVAVPTESANPTATPAPTSPAATPASAVATPPAQPAVKQLGADALRFDTPTSVYVFDQTTGGLKSIVLKDYQATNAKDSAPIELLDGPLYVQGTTSGSGEINAAFSGERQDNVISFSHAQGAWQIAQKYKVPANGYVVDLEISYTNTAGTAADLDAGLMLQEAVQLPKKSGSFLPGMPGEQYHVIATIDGSLKKELAKDFCEDGSKNEALSANNEDVEFLGFDRHYFLSALLIDRPKFSFAIQKNGGVTNDGHCSLRMYAHQSQGAVQPGQTVTIPYRLYLGPKDVTQLVAADPKLKQAVDLGWFGVVAHPLLITLNAFYKFLHNYGLAIILLTLILKVAFYPLTKAAAVSMKKMQKLQPEMNRIREKHKDDPQAQQKEIMQFMAAHKINPAKGCLPILPQIPVFIAFYNVLSQSIELRHAPFFGWIRDLSAHDPYYISPILLGVGMFVQQKLTPNPSMDKTQEKIMLMLPIIFTAMMLSLPAGMVIYMITNTIVSIAQQQWLNRRLK